MIALSTFAPACSDDDEPTIREEHEATLSTVEVQGDTLAFLDVNGASDRGTLVLLHGIPTSSLLYRKVAPAIAERTGWRVIALDLLGFGASDKPLRAGAYSVGAHAARTLETLSNLGVSNFVLGLHDIGGFVGWEMLSRSDERIDALAIVNTTAYADGLTPAPRTQEIIAGEKTPREAWGALDDPEFAHTVAREFLEIGLADPADASDELVSAYAAPLSEGSSEAFVQFFEGIGPVLMSEPERRQTFTEYGRPVLVVHGDQDRFFEAATVTRLFAEDFAVPESRVRIVEGAGHYVQEDAPDAYVEALSDFLLDLD
ncbi:MAG: alpha/beta hydrolase [Myxococcota bacterium]